MRYFWDIYNFPEKSRILLVESGTRELLEKAIPTIRTFWDGKTPPIDLFTCFGGVPEGIGDDGEIFRVADYPGPERKKLLRELKSRGYAVMCVVCSEEKILAKWKLMIILGVPAKLLVINECGDCFWCDRNNWALIRRFVASRSGMTGATVLRSVLQIAVLPLTFLWLMLFAAVAHTTRLLNRQT
ncbi:MAG TPA: hypothetical protein VGL72_06815 [Bryobacteraceae bacterium]